MLFCSNPLWPIWLRRACWLLLGSLLLPMVLPAAESSPWFVRVWQTDDGLSDNDVVDVAQSAEGYLWISTQSSLSRFDGVRFREVELPQLAQKAHRLIRNTIITSDQSVWMAMEGGVVASLSSSYTNFYSTADGLPNYRPTSLAQAGDGAIWIGYVDGSACRIAAGKVTRFTARSGLWGVGQCVLTSDVRGQIWLAKAGSLFVFRGAEFDFIVSLPEGVTRLASARSGGIWANVGSALLKVEEGQQVQTIATLNSTVAGLAPSAIFEDHSGSVWIGTLVGGLFRVTDKNIMAVPTSHPDILKISEDREGNIWVGTGGGGLNRLRLRIVDLQTAANGLPFSSVRSLCEDANGTLWAATQNGELAQRDTVSWASGWRNVSGESGWSGARTTCVTSDGKGGVWVGTSHGGLRHWIDGHVTVLGRGDGLGGDIVRALFTDREGNLWIGLEAPSSFQCYRDGKFQNLSLPFGVKTVRALAQDPAGTIWAGTADGFLFRVDDKGRLEDVTRKTLAQPKPIRCLFADPAGDLWIGYAGAGVGRIRHGTFSSISTSQGLHDANICAITADDGGGVWFSSDRGIFQVRQRELAAAMAGKIESVRSVLYGRDESLPNLEGNFGYSPGFVRISDGRIWFPTHIGIAVINPNRTLPNHLAPPVFIERLLVDNQPVSVAPGSVAKIPPQHRKIEIEFTALSFAAPENVGFRYRLEGWDGGWVNAPHLQRSVAYTRLPVGKYSFRVTACNNAGIWNESGTTLTFEVEPFLWQTFWFRLVALVILIGSVASVAFYASRRRYRARLKKLEQETALQKERARIAKDLHDELGASLTQISLLGKLTQHDLASPEKAGEHVGKIANLARQGVKSVDEIVWAVTPRNDNLSQLLDYAGQHAVDFLQAAGIRCRIDFPEKFPDREVHAEIRHGVFMVVKEALNNAVKHSGATEIKLVARLEGNLLRLAVIDNGRGFSSVKEDALADGLRNMKQRVTDLGGQCFIESKPGAGTNIRVELHLPL